MFFPPGKERTMSVIIRNIFLIYSRYLNNIRSYGMMGDERERADVFF